MTIVLEMISQPATMVVLLLICLACQFLWAHWKILRVAWKLPSLNPMPVLPCVGSVYLISRGTSWSLNYIINTIKDAMLNGELKKAVFWAGPLPFFTIIDPEDVHAVMNSSKSLAPGITTHFMSVMLGNGLITAPVDVWKVTRRHVNVMFHPRNLELVCPAMNECGRDLVASLTRHVDCGLVDVLPLVEPIIFKSTLKLVFGTEAEVNMHSEKFRKALKSIMSFSERVAQRVVKVYSWPDPIFRLLNRKELREFDLSFDTYINEIIEVSRKRRLLRQISSNKKDDFVSNHLDIDHASQYKNVQITLEDTYKEIQEKFPNITEKDFNYEIRTLLGAATESTRITLSSCLLALAAKPRIQEKLYSEIVSVTGPQDSDVTPEDIRAMPYLDQVLKETLRKFLIVPMINRSVDADLKLNDWSIPAGSNAAVLIFAVHHNPKLYPEPERFDPDRFSPENVAARGKNSFIPFSGGPKNCIGKKYATMTMKTLLVHAIKRFKFYTTVDIETRQPLLFGVASMLADGYRVKIESRRE